MTQIQPNPTFTTLTRHDLMRYDDNNDCEHLMIDIKNMAMNNNISDVLSVYFSNLIDAQTKWPRLDQIFGSMKISYEEDSDEDYAEDEEGSDEDYTEDEEGEMMHISCVKYLHYICNVAALRYDDHEILKKVICANTKMTQVSKLLTEQTLQRIPGIVFKTLGIDANDYERKIKASILRLINDICTNMKQFVQMLQGKKNSDNTQVRMTWRTIRSKVYDLCKILNCFNNLFETLYRIAEKKEATVSRTKRHHEDNDIVEAEFKKLKNLTKHQQRKLINRLVKHVSDQTL